MTTHTFAPTRYHTTMGTHPAALQIAPGDSVRTSTVDASGRDATNQVVTTGGNPQTGPFYIEGAQPGDTLIVRLDELTPNRDSGWTSQTLAANVVDPDLVAALWRHPEGVPHTPAFWDIDTQAGTATLREPATQLGRLALPLRPMLGCFGVAPTRGQAISTATSGQHGGNMDYNGFVAGTTVFFPVEAEGALFSLGDGHALQGDGEIAGTGIEISFDVTFTVDLIQGQRIGWPRGENATHIFTVGNARPLDQCVQHATSELVRWLRDGYGLDMHSIGMLLGQAVQYDMGNMFDPAYTMVCKLPKQVLNAATRR
ncbi:MAG: acetamidase/formamidase family protein [Roseiflexaceae bacterium]|nr:acetamidase/formamidase family protein [Roseiflexaceae bacterium]